jgi:hypothetical protein
MARTGEIQCEDISKVYGTGSCRYCEAFLKLGRTEQVELMDQVSKSIKGI